MAINLKDFTEHQVEKRLPIIILVDESGFGSEIKQYKCNLGADSNGNLKGISFSSIEELDLQTSSNSYICAFLDTFIDIMCKKNIRSSLAVISYGDTVAFKYPILNDGTPYLEPIENIAQKKEDLFNVILGTNQSKLAVLGSAIRLAKAMIDDIDTIGNDNYEPVILILSSGQPTAGWDEELVNLKTIGRSSCAKIIFVNMGEKADISQNVLDIVNHVYDVDFDKGSFITAEVYKPSNENITFKASASEILLRIKKLLKEPNVVQDNPELDFSKTLIGAMGIITIDSDENDPMKMAYCEQKELRRLGKTWSISDILGKQSQFFLSSNKKALFDTPLNSKSDGHFIYDRRNSDEKYNGDVQVEHLVSQFTYMPIERVQTEINVEKPTVSLPDDIMGDNPDAVGEGFI